MVAVQAARENVAEDPHRDDVDEEGLTVTDADLARELVFGGMSWNSSPGGNAAHWRTS